MRLTKVIILLSCLGLLNACGFKMRGEIDLPEAMKKIYLDGASGKLQTAFRQSIKASKGTMVRSKDQAGIIINILEEEFDRRTISLSSRGRSTEFELNYYLIYELRDAEENILVPEQTVEIIKDYFDNQSDVIAKDIEGNIIRDEIYHQAVRRIIDKTRFDLKKLELKPET